MNLGKQLGRSVVFVYPRTSPPEGAPADWQMIPGARGCTAESCTFRDLADDFSQLGAQIFGVSTQDTSYQSEAHSRLHLSYPLVSDTRLVLAEPLRLQTFEHDGSALYRRATLIVESGAVAHRFDNIADPEAHPHDVLRWIERAG